MKFKILIHHAEEGGFWAEIPALPGCFTQGETIEGLLANSEEAIQAFIIGSQMLDIESDVRVEEIEVS